MRKVYLFLTAAMLLVCSGLWAGNQAKVGDTEYATVGDAINAWATNGGELTLLEDCNYETENELTLKGGYSESTRKEFVLNLNDKHLTWNVTKVVTSSGVNALTVGMYGSLTINGGDSNAGKITFNGSNTEKNFNGLNPYSHNKAITKINGGTFEAYNNITTGDVNVLVIAYNNKDSGISDEAKFENHVTSTAGRVIKSGSYKIHPDAAYVATNYIYEKNGDYYNLVNEGNYIVSVNGDGYTKDNVTDIWTDFAGEDILVEVLSTDEFEIPATFAGTVSLKTSSSSSGVKKKILNNGKLNFPTITAATTYGNLTITNNGTVTMGESPNYKRTFPATSSITNNGTLIVNQGNSFNTKCTVSGDGLFDLRENSIVPVSFKSFANVTIPENCVWAYSSSTEYKIVPNTGLKVTVNGVYYSTVAAAMNASSEAYPATLQADCSELDLGTFAKNVYLDMNGFNLQFNSGFKQTKGSLNIENSKTAGGKITCSSTSNIAAIEVRGAKNNTDKTTVNIGANVTIEKAGTEGAVIGVYGYSTDTSKAYGVTVNVRGNLTGSQCVTINGEVTDLNTYPEINIYDGAVLTGTNCANSACIYAAGYGVWNIGAANLNAATPIYAKSGVINIDGATIEACGAKADPKPYNSGFYSTGDAIVMDTNNSYAGAVLLNIYGDAKITSTNGYAIQEVITNGTTSSAAGIAISGDNTVIEGAAGSLQMTENFKDAMKDGSSETYQWVLNGIAGGVYSKVPGVVADGYVAQEVEIGGKKYYQVVVADPESPAPASQTTYIVNDTEWDYSVEYKNSSALVITTGNTLKVKGVNVNRTSSEDVSKVTVEAGAKLIVGAEGIQTNSANGLLLKSDAVHGMGMLLYDGSTTATSPYGTAELYLFSKKIADNNYIWQHFGIPTVATPSIEKNVTISVNKWDVKKGWIWDGGSSVLTDAWTGFNIATNHEEAGSIVKFGGQLIGNGDATLVLDKYGYNALANSYTAPVNLKSVIDAVYDASTDGAVWIYSAKEALETGIKQFHSFGSDTPEDESLNPMQAFFVLHESDASDNATISYEDAVLGYNTRAAVANNYNKATLKITGGGEADEFTIYEGEQFSSSIDKGYDIKQMNHDFIQIYAIQNGENYASVATDDAENLELTIKTKAATQYTLSFSGISEGYGVKLTDVKSGAEIEVGNDKTYTFTADANTTAVRFRFGKSEVSADEANADAVKIWSANGSLFVEGNAAEADIEIINLSGVKVASAKASGEAVQAVSISNLASGVYVVRVGNTAAKIVK